MSWKCWPFSVYALTSAFLGHILHLILKISVKTIWTKLEVIPMDLDIYSTVRCDSFKKTRWMASTCSSIVDIVWRPSRKSFVQSLLRLKSTTCFFTVTFEEESTASTLRCNTFILQIFYCNIMAEGFRFMPFGLGRLRTFLLSAWVT